MRPTVARLGLIALLVGAPAALGAALGPPGIPSFGSSASVSGSYVPVEPILETLGLLAWILWGYLAFAILLHTVAIVASSRGFGPHEALLEVSSALTPKVVRQFVELAAGGILLAASISVRVAASAPHVHRAAAAVVAARDFAPQDLAVVAAQRRPHRVTYRVRPGDSLWRIAERELGSGLRWKEIFELNRGRHFRDGRSLTNPHLIHPGWALDLPGTVKETSPPERGRTVEPGQDETEQVPSPGVPEGPGLIRAEMSPADTREGEPGSSAEMDAEPEEPEERPSTRPAISLPSGLVVAASFASGLLTAHLLGRLRRRRSRRVSSAGPQEPPVPPQLIQDLRRAGATQMASPFDVALDAVADAWREATGTWPAFLAAVEAERHLSAILCETGAAVPKTAGGNLSPHVRFLRAEGTIAAEIQGPFPTRLRSSARTPLERGVLVPLGQSPDGSAVHISLTALGPLSVTGPNSEGLARQLTLAAATLGGPEDVQLFLFGASEDMQQLTGLPHVVVSKGWEDSSGALREIRLEFLRRARLFVEESIEGIGGHLAHHSDERLPALLIVACEPPSALRGLVEALGREATALGGGMLAVGWALPDSRFHVRAGAVLEVETELPCPKVLKPFVLDPRAEEQAIEVISEAFPGETEEREAMEPIAAALDLQRPMPPTPGSGAIRAMLPGSQPSARVLPRPVEPPEPPLDLAAVRCLGPLEISRRGTVLAKGWKAKSRELLAYLIAHPDGAAKERIIEELWPEIEPGQGVARFDRAASQIRTQARGTESARAFLERVGDSYRLEMSAWWVDAWEFERLTGEARRTDDEVDAVTKLRNAVALYRGEFCDDQYYSWAESIRERMRALFLDASARLADQLAGAAEPEEALSVLDRATSADPVCEDLVRRAMVIEAALGRRAAAISRYKKLEAVLDEELGVEPDPETQTLARRLVPQRRAEATG